MPKYTPSWAYGKFRIVPDRKNFGYWNVQERGVFFWHRWIEFVYDYTQVIQFVNIKDAKDAIDFHIKSYSEKKIYGNNIKEWRKQKPIDYP